jgi:hypothetical protein
MIIIPKPVLIFFMTFPNQKVCYTMAFRSGDDLIIENNIDSTFVLLAKTITLENILMQLLALTKKQIQTIIISLILMDKNYT